MSATTGVPVWRTPNRYIQPAPGYHYFSYDPREFLAPSLDPQLGTWYPAAVAEARERVIEAARVRGEVKPGQMRWRDWLEVERELGAALAALDALKAAT